MYMSDQKRYTLASKNTSKIATSDSDSNDDKDGEKFMPLSAPVKPRLPIIPVANKCESDKSFDAAMEIYQLNLGNAPVALSSTTKEGFSSLYTALQEAMNTLLPYKLALKEYKTTMDRHNRKMTQSQNIKRLQLSVVGRPNVGKSTLVNRLLGYNRVLTGEQPGVTRDQVKIEFQSASYPSYLFELVDTAGLKGLTVEKISRFGDVDGLAMFKSFNAVNFAHVVLLVVDGTERIDTGVIPMGNLDKHMTQDEKDAVLVKTRNIFSRTDIGIARKVAEEVGF